jgi:myo-inositol-1(or 4)-monophosphatase
MGSAALDLAWVAAGRYDGFWERNLKAWDIAAGIVLVKEAGGWVSELDDKSDILATGNIVAGNEAIQAELKKRLTA